MLRDIVEVKPLEGYQLHIRFEDGAQGIVDIRKLVPWVGVFAALKDPAQFREAYVDQELGTVCWPGGADLDPDVLYALVTGTPIPSGEAEVV